MSAPATYVHVPAVLAPIPSRSLWPARSALLAAILVCALSLGAGWLPVQVSGRILDVEWRPLAGATASLLVDGSQVGTTTTNAGGWFQLRGGHTYQRYEVLASAPGFLPARLDPLTGTALLHELGGVSGQVVDERGAAVVDARVTLQPQGSRDTISVHTDATGAFALQRALAPGSFHVLVLAPNHDPFEGSLTISQDSTQTLTAVIARQLGTLALATDPAGLRLLLDGQPIADCPATPCTVVVVAGKHLLSVGDDLYVPWQQELEIQRQATITVNQPLQRKQGTLVVNAGGGSSGELRVDGYPISPGWRGLLPTGTHLVSYRGPAVWPALASVTVEWNQEASVTLSASAVETSDPNKFVAQMNAYLSKLGGDYGVYLQDLINGQEMGSSQNDWMEAASVIKIPVALYTYKQAELGAISLDDKVTLAAADFMGGTGTLYGSAHAGDQYAFKDLVALLIRQSDNTAWQALRRTFRSSSIDSYAASIGAPDCHQVDDNCTAREAGVMLAGLHRGKLLNPADTQALLQLLETTAFNDRINYYLRGMTIAHKVGMDGNVMNDAGIVYLPGRPYIVSMFTATGDPDTGVQAIRDVSRAANWFYAH